MADKTMEDVVDGRVKLLGDSLELKLTKALDQTLRERAEANRKLFTWAVGSVTVVLTVLGFKTVADMRDVARTSATEAVKQRLSLDDPNSEIRRDIDNILAKALIDSNMLKLAKPPDENGFASDIALSDRDTDRIGRFILDPNTKGDDFYDGLDLLMRTEARDNERSYVEDLRKLLTEPQSWLVRRPEKVEAILKLTSDDSVNDYSRRVLQDANANRKVILAAIQYSARSADLQAVPILEKMAGFPDQVVVTEALTAVASLQPTSLVVRNSLAAPVNPEDADSARKLLKVAGGLAKPSRRTMFLADPQEKLRTQLIIGALQRTIAADYVFRSMDIGFRRRSSGQGITKRGDPGPIYGIGEDLFKPHGLKAAGVVLQQASASPVQFQRALTALCLADRTASCRAVAKVTLGPGASILLDGSPPLDGVGAPAGVIIDVSELGGVQRPIAIWKDRAGAEHTAPVIGVRNAAKATFTLAMRKSDSGLA